MPDSVSALPRQFGPNLLAGSLGAVMTLAYACSFASLIFGGSLAPAASFGVMTALVGSCTAILALSWLSSFPFAMGGPDSNPSAILAISVAAIAGEILHSEGPDAPALLPTVFMFLFVSAVLCGLLLFLVGQRRWGRFVRYIPHPVVGGFLAGTGFLLVAGAWKMLFGQPIAQTTAVDLAAVPAIGWITALGVALALTVGLQFSRHFLLIPAIIALAVICFHAGRLGLGLSLEEARASGLLLAPLQPGKWHHVLSEPWHQVRWDLLLAHGKDFAAMTMVVLITILLNATSLDLATGRDADFDRELKALGVANVLGGLCGGLVAVNSFNRSLLNLRAGATSPLAARLCAALVLGTALLAPGAVAFLPRPVLTGLVLFLGVNLMLSWLWASRRELPVVDYLTVFAILAIVAVLGIVAGVALGIAIACLGFVVSFSRQSVVKQRFTSATRRSNVERTPADVAWLGTHGGRLRGFVLHGHLFFGTANSLLEEIREVLGQTQILVIDFWLVRDIDASAVVILRKLLRLAGERGAHIAFTGLGPAMQQRLDACGLPLADGAVRLFADLDHGLEWGENQLLKNDRTRVDVMDALGFLENVSTGELAAFFSEIQLPAGATLCRRGERSDEMYFVLAGRVSVHLQFKETEYNRRLRSYGPGTIVGEMGFFSGTVRSADVTADVDTRLARLGQDSMRQIERDHPMLAVRIHRFVINTLAARLLSANEELRHML